jgi:hypothetical protein
MAIDINSFGREYGLEWEMVQAVDHSTRLAVANGEPAFEDSQEYNLITGNPLLCQLDSGEWALVRSTGTTRFNANGRADAVARAKDIIVDK